MNKKERKSLVPPTLASLTILAFGGILFFLYQKSSYLLFLLSSIFLLTLAATNLILLLFRPELDVPKRPLSQKKDKQDKATSVQVAEPPNEPISESEETTEQKQAKKRPNIDKEALLALLRRGKPWLAYGFAKVYRPLEVLLLAFALIGGTVWFSMKAFQTMPVPSTLAYWQLVVVVALFVITIVVDKFCKHTDTSDRFAAMILRNARAFFSLMRIFFVLCALTMTLQLLNIYNIERYVRYAFIILTYYAVAMILFSLTVRTIRKELAKEPGIVIILPFFNADIKELAVISFLEENTGITLRSLWSIRYVKRLIPFAIVGAALVFWISTGIVYVESHQQGAVYRFGTLQEETLEPGLHLTFPYPIDQTKVYNTQTINKVTIGYKSTENADNVWTAAHGEEEYKLLLGSGTELVSINLRVEYRIADLKQYLRTATQPERILEAKAYELVTLHTIENDLDGMIATNRETFAKHFYEEMVTGMEPMNTGLEVVSIVLESIHPPVDVAEVYQKFIGAEIDAETMILEAQATATKREQAGIAEAYQCVRFAEADQMAKIAAAKTEIATFESALNATNTYPEAYKYYKYLDALSSAYKKAKLVIVGNGVDSGRLFFGNMNGST